jgi:hypothetical protein
MRRRPDELGLTVSLTVPGVATLWVPMPNVIVGRRHFPLSLTRPFMHITCCFEATTPSAPLWKLSTQLNVPGLTTASVKLMAPLLGFTVDLPLKLLCPSL